MEKPNVLEASSRPVPYDTGKVKIGQFYEPARPQMGEEELYWQDLLLGVQAPPKPPLLHRVLSNLIISVGFGVAFVLYILILFRG